MRGILIWTCGVIFAAMPAFAQADSAFRSGSRFDTTRRYDTKRDLLDRHSSRSLFGRDHWNRFDRDRSYFYTRPHSQFYGGRYYYSPYRYSPSPHGYYSPRFYAPYRYYSPYRYYTPYYRYHEPGFGLRFDLDF